MEKLEMLKNMVKGLEEVGDAYLYTTTKGEIDITINDFEGFDDDWNEVDRDYVNPEGVEELENWLEENAEEKTGDFYTYYKINGVTVCLGYTSFEI